MLRKFFNVCPCCRVANFNRCLNKAIHFILKLGLGPMIDEGLPKFQNIQLFGAGNQPLHVGGISDFRDKIFIS